MDAEHAYLFRHAVLRDAAYGLQPPSARADLHKLALAILEHLVPDADRDAIARELAFHAHQGQQADKQTTRSHGLIRKELDYELRAARWAEKTYHPDAAIASWLRCAHNPLATPAQKMLALTRSADWHANLGRGREADAVLAGAERWAVDDSTRRTLLACRGNLARQSSRFAQAEQDYTQALALSSGHEAAVMLANRAVARMHQGRLAEAEQDFNEAGGIGGVGTSALQDHAILAFHSGRREESLRMFRDAADLAQSGGDPRIAATILANMASVLFNLGRSAEALAPLHQALSLQRQIGDLRGEASTLSVLGALDTVAGNYQQAVRWSLRSVELNREAANLPILAITLRNLAALYLVTGDVPSAEPLAAESYVLETAAGNTTGEGLCLVVSGMLAHARRDFARAVEYHQRALALLEGGATAEYLADATIQLGRSLRDAGKLTEAGAALDRAMELCSKLHRPEIAASVAGHAALLALAQGDPGGPAAWSRAWAQAQGCGSCVVRDEMAADAARYPLARSSVR